jgi:hypothetical protein
LSKTLDKFFTLWYNIIVIKEVIKMIKVKIYDKATDKIKRIVCVKGKKELHELLMKGVNHETERAVPLLLKNLLARVERECKIN